ncbi:MAG: hypothetical protein ACLTK0_07620 [Anaerovoracaceae bacterium]
MDSQGVDKFINSIAGIFSGSDEEGTAEPEPAAEVTYITEYINIVSRGGKYRKHFRKYKP